MRVRYSARTDVGMRREVNQDYHGEAQGDFGTLLIVCDGMGGHAAGEVASRIAVETIVAEFAPAAEPAEALRSAFTVANQRVYEEGHGSMGTTGVAALLRRNAVHIANVGDSRAYLVREGKIQQISQDHSFVSDQVAAGLMTPEQARTSNVRNIITRALGHQPGVEVDTFVRGLRPGDTIVLSSDGMHGLIDDAEIAEVTSMLPPDQAAQRLVDTANQRGGTDNITVVIAVVDEVDPPLPGESAVTEPLDDADDDEPAAGATIPVGRAAPAASAAPRERPLSRLGLVLSALTLVVLLGLGGFLYANRGAPPAASPAASPTPARTDTAVTATAATPTTAITPSTAATAATPSAAATPRATPAPRPTAAP